MFLKDYYLGLFGIYSLDRIEKGKLIKYRNKHSHSDKSEALYIPEEFKNHLNIIPKEYTETEETYTGRYFVLNSNKIDRPIVYLPININLSGTDGDVEMLQTLQSDLVPKLKVLNEEEVGPNGREIRKSNGREKHGGSRKTKKSKKSKKSSRRK